MAYDLYGLQQVSLTPPKLDMATPLFEIAAALKRGRNAGGDFGGNAGENVGRNYSPARGSIGAGDTGRGYANVRYNNPGAMYPGKAAAEFGSTGTGIIGGGHKIAMFPTPVHGAAANMRNIVTGGYVGMPIGQAISKWSGGGRSSVPGFNSSEVITPELARNPAFMVPFMKAVTSGEAPGKYPMNDDQWRNAFDWYISGRPGS